MMKSRVQTSRPIDRTLRPHFGHISRDMEGNWRREGTFSCRSEVGAQADVNITLSGSRTGLALHFVNYTEVCMHVSSSSCTAMMQKVLNQLPEYFSSRDTLVLQQRGPEPIGNIETRIFDSNYIAYECSLSQLSAVLLRMTCESSQSIVP